MKSSIALSILATVAISLVGVRGDAVSCSVIDYLYYSSDCCDNSNSVQCMESIPKTDKAAIDNLASLKRPDGNACQSGDTIKFSSSKIVCADDDTCIIPCANGNITGTVGDGCTCTCETGFQGADCSTVTPCPACQNGGVLSGSVSGGDCACDCSGTNHTGALCEVAPASALDDYTKTDNSYCDGADLAGGASATTPEECAALCTAEVSCNGFNFYTHDPAAACSLNTCPHVTTAVGHALLDGKVDSYKKNP